MYRGVPLSLHRVSISTSPSVWVSLSAFASTIVSPSVLTESRPPHFWICREVFRLCVASACQRVFSWPSLLLEFLPWCRPVSWPTLRLLCASWFWPTLVVGSQAVSRLKVSLSHNLLSGEVCQPFLLVGYQPAKFFSASPLTSPSLPQVSWRRPLLKCQKMCRAVPRPLDRAVSGQRF